MWKKQNRSSAPMTRLVKSSLERRRRLRVQKKRLLALGVTEAAIRQMNSSQIREMLRRPARISKMARK